MLLAPIKAIIGDDFIFIRIYIYFRYGIRVDPFQWFIVLTGRDEGSGVPSIILLLCN